MAEIKTAEYMPTERAGKRVAGFVVEKDKTLTLTEAQAEHGLAEGTIVPKGKQLHKAFTEETKPVARMRDEAAAFRNRGVAPAPEAEEAAEASPGKSGDAAA